MAALQTLRNKPALLMSVIGGALLLFIITMVVENHNPFGPSDKAGKAFGQTIKITDLNQEIEDAINFQTVSRTLQNMANGNNELVKLSEQEREQVRQSTWQANVEELAMLEEINKLGLTVTDEELTNYLQNANFQTQSQEVQLMIMVGYIFSGNPTIAGYQQFLKDYDKIIQQYAQSSSDMVEFVQSVKRASVYAENNLKKTLLQNKYMTLLQGSFISNPVSAKALFNDVYTKYDFEIAAVSSFSYA
jgi:peptidyl-prolyl cis-trans isomerase D